MKKRRRFPVMKERHSLAFRDYLAAFQEPDEPFLFFYRVGKGGGVDRRGLTRGAFLSLAGKAAGVLRDAGQGKGCRILHCFGANDVHDLAFRLAGAMIGTVPVTVNWQDDPLDRLLYKCRQTEATMVVTGASFDPALREGLQARLPDIPFFDADGLGERRGISAAEYEADLGEEDTKIIIFTSGTTGNPKGAQLAYRSYRNNRAAFEQMLAIRPADRFAAVVVNPMHHTNSTAITDWALRRPGSHVHLIEKYSTGYWEILTGVAAEGYDRILAPTVSRHFDFLEELAAAERLLVPLDKLKEAMGRIDFLIGSAPVGPTTVGRLQRYAGRIPTVRFGSTETCLQVLGIPRTLDDGARLEVFERGWAHHVQGEPLSGYYIGRPHEPYTEVRIVRGVVRGGEGFMVDVPTGTPGYLITRGGNVMTGYVGNPEATREVFEDGWYLGLKDICFALENPRDGRLDYFWVSRDSSLLIRGGANYAYDQISAQLADFVVRRYGLPRESFQIAVVGLRVESEHEDSCCVTMELLGDEARRLQPVLEESFLREAKRGVSKGARPDILRFAEIPRNFKGALLVPQLKKDTIAYLTSLGRRLS